MSVAQKVEIGLLLESLRVDVIETGFPAASEIDFQATKLLSRALKHSKVCAFARACHKDIEIAFDAIKEAPVFQILIMTTASDSHLAKKRRISRDQALKEAKQSVSLARSIGFSEVVVGPEDATRADMDFLHRMIDVSLESGATGVCVPDTVGSCLPEEYGEIMMKSRSWTGPAIHLSAHTHNDLGLATANCLAAIQAGVDECQVTLGGIGERAGNAALEEVVANVVCKQGRFHRAVNVDTTKIWNVCSSMMAMLNIPVSRSKPIIGANAFSTSAGIHQAGMLRDPTTYEVLDPDTFGANRSLVITRHSGRDALEATLRRLGLPTDEEAITRTFDRLKANRHMTIFSDEEIVILARPGVEGARDWDREKNIESTRLSHKELHG
jgi:2-isopropylmalate synthase